MTSIAGYILGEYGHLIANETGYSPLDQFHLLHSKSQFCVASTRSLLLTTYIKWVNVFPEIRPQLLNIFDRYRHVLDAELQQRACEYFALASRPEDDDFLPNVCEEMPPFPPRVSALLGRLSRKHGDTEDKRTWIHGGKEANLERKVIEKVTPTATNGQAETGDIMSSLAGLDLSSVAAQSTPEPGSSNPPRPIVGPNVDKWYDKLTYTNEGVLYEDVQIQIGIKSRYQGSMGQIAIYFGNKVTAPLTAFTAALYVPDTEALSVSFAKIPPSTIDTRSQSQQLLNIECKKVFSQPPILTVSYLAGSHQAVSLRLPITVTKFFEHVKLGQADFFERWKLIGGPPREAQAVFPIDLVGSQLDLKKHRDVVSGNKLNVLSDIDPNPSNIVAAGVLHTSLDGKVGCLLRLEPNQDAKVSIPSFVFTAAHAAMFSPALQTNVSKYFRGGLCGSPQTDTEASSGNEAAGAIASPFSSCTQLYTNLLSRTGNVIKGLYMSKNSFLRVYRGRLQIQQEELPKKAKGYGKKRFSSRYWKILSHNRKMPLRMPFFRLVVSSARSWNDSLVRSFGGEVTVFPVFL